MVVKQKQNKEDEDNESKIDKEHKNIDDDEWPISNIKIVLHRVGRQRRKKKYQYMGSFPDAIYPDYYHSPLLLLQRENPQMYDLR